MGNFSELHGIFQGLHGDLEAFADRVSSYLGCPVTIEDSNHRLLAYSMHDDRTDKARISTIIGRRVPEKVISSLWKEGIIPQLLKDPSPVKVPSISDVGLGNRAAVSIWKNDEVLGFIWALEVEKPFSENDMLFLQYAAKEARSQLLQVQSRKNRKIESDQELLWQLLTGHFQDEKTVREKFKGHTALIPQSFSILVFEFPEDISYEREKQISYMLTTTQRIKAEIFTADKNRLIILASLKEAPPAAEELFLFTEGFISQMNTRFNAGTIEGGAGSIILNLTDSKQSYQEALQVLSLRQMFPHDTEKVFLYSQLGVLRFLETLYINRNKNYQNPHLACLLDYDSRHQTELFTTLKTYLEKDSNPNETAKALHIHVNTLTYRLKRITDVGTLNLKEPLQKVGLYLDLKLMQYDSLKKSRNG
ncbi:PucR family transcriptional regulator [Peribacillus sp. SCS-26]|uniref:PucR family transcriptional regulator n=1 Tax=Paraperibacillus marinus TaxID=3115295 RepID=UPI0039065010